MAHPDYAKSALSVPAGGIQGMIEKLTEQHQTAVAALAESFGITEGQADIIFVLRGQDHWSQDKEDFCLWLAKNRKLDIPMPHPEVDFELPKKGEVYRNHSGTMKVSYPEGMIGALGPNERPSKMPHDREVY